MDKVNQAIMLANTEVVKEPRGFIKFLQIVLAICAFATTTSYYGSTSFSYSNCEMKQNTSMPCTITLDFAYPFRLDEWLFAIKNGSTTTRVSMYGDFSPAAQFYVFVGVISFLYALLSIILYIFLDDKYRQNETPPAADLVITAVLVILWLVASSAWADGVTKVKHYTFPLNLWRADANEHWHCPPEHKCQVISEGSYASLNVSIIFGFLNTFLWAGNIWFLYKETRWFGGGNAGGSSSSSDFPPPRSSEPFGSPDSPQRRI